ncbi:hypothetical protein V8E54_014706, partial [Elaphomyces granulatus]
DWEFLGQVTKVLRRFHGHTLYISRSEPQINYAVPIYNDLHDLMHDAMLQIRWRNLRISMKTSRMLYIFKYHDFMDGQDIYYIALILNPR